MNDSSTTSGFWGRHDPEDYETEFPTFIDESGTLELIEKGVRCQVFAVRGP
jgi:hypothetical protein